MNRGKIILSIDDGSADNYRLFQFLRENHLPATFNIVTNRIGNAGNMTQEQLMEIADSPLMEIACHSHTHQNTDEDILLGKNLLKEWLVVTEPMGFASPGSQMRRDDILANTEHLRKLGLLYVRTSENRVLNDQHRALQDDLLGRGASRFVIKNVAQFLYEVRDMFVPSAVVMHDTNVEDMKMLADLAAREKAAIVFMFHRIKRPDEPNYEELWCYDWDQMCIFLRHLLQQRDLGKLEVVTNRSLYL